VLQGQSANWILQGRLQNVPCCKMQIEQDWSGGQSRCAGGTPSTDEYGTCLVMWGRDL